MPVRYLPNPRPTEALTSYTGDKSALWTPDGPTAPKAMQPSSDSNPNGGYGSIPVMSITAAVAAVLAGPQDSAGDGKGFNPSNK